MEHCQYAIGISTKGDPAPAVDEAAGRALAGLGGKRPDITVLFVAADPHAAPAFLGLQELIGKTAFIGCTTNGIIHQKSLYPRGAVALMVKSDHAGPKPVTTAELKLKDDSRRAGRRFGQKLSKTGKNSLLLIFQPGSIAGKEDEVLRGIYEMLGSGVKYAGGETGDNGAHGTSIIHEGEHAADAAAAAFLPFDAPVGVGAAHGWKPMKEPVLVTNAEREKIFELDWRPAVHTYQDLVAKMAAPSRGDVLLQAARSHPLGIPVMHGEYVIREPLRFFEDGSISCAGEVPKNAVVRIMQTDRESLIESAARAAEDALAQLGGGRPGLALVFDDALRSEVLGPEGYRRSLEAVAGIVGQDVPLVGCLTRGEIGSLKGGPPKFLNNSIVVALLPQ